MLRTVGGSTASRAGGIVLASLLQLALALLLTSCSGSGLSPTKAGEAISKSEAFKEPAGFKLFTGRMNNVDPASYQPLAERGWVTITERGGAALTPAGEIESTRWKKAKDFPNLWHLPIAKRKLLKVTDVQVLMNRAEVTFDFEEIPTDYLPELARNVRRTGKATFQRYNEGWELTGMNLP